MGSFCWLLDILFESTGPPRDGTFQTAVSYGSGGNEAYYVAVADLNGDGKPDIIVANCGGTNQCGNASGVVGVLLGNGDGTFQTAVSYDSGGFDRVTVAGSVAVASRDRWNQSARMATFAG